MSNSFVGIGALITVAMGILVAAIICGVLFIGSCVYKAGEKAAIEDYQQQKTEQVVK